MPFEALRETLLRSGIAPRHVGRYLRELDDHLADLTEAQQATGYDGPEAASRARALLGGDAELAAAMLARPELKSWAARAPWLVFGLLPPLAIMAGFFALALLLVLTADSQGAWMQSHTLAPRWFQLWAHATADLANIGLGPGLAALMVWTAVRQRLNWKWPLLATAIIALAGIHMIARFPAPEQQHGGQIAIGVLGELAGWPFPMTGPLWGLQFLLTLAPLLWLLRRRRLFAGEREPS